MTRRKGKGRAYEEIVLRAKARVEDIVSRVPSPEEYLDRQRELATAELEAVRNENLSREQLLEQLAIHRAALTQAKESKARADALALAFAVLFSEVATKVEAAPKAGGKGLAKVNLTSKGQTFADAKAEIRRVWETGAYPSKNKCAAGECGRLGVSLKTALKAMAPDPSAKHRG